MSIKKYKVISVIFSIILIALAIFMAVVTSYTEPVETIADDSLPVGKLVNRFNTPAFISCCTFLGAGIVLLVIAFAFILLNFKYYFNLVF